MKKSLYFLISLTIILSTLPLLAQKANVANVRSYTIDQFMEIVKISSPNFSADGDMILYTSDASGVPNAWKIPFKGGEPQQLTHSLEALQTHGFFPTGEKFLYSADKGGDELTHLYVHNRDGTVSDLTPGEKVRAIFLEWSSDKRSFFFASNERDPRAMDIYEMKLDDLKKTLLYRNEGGYRVGAISPDRRYLAMVRLNLSQDTNLFLYDRKTEQYTDFSPEEDAIQRPIEFSHDGHSLFYLTDEGSEFRYLMRYDIRTGKHTTGFRAQWDIENAKLSPKGRYLIVQINNDARTELRILNAETLQPVQFSSIPRGDITQITFSPDESRLALVVGSGRSPANLHALGLEEGDARVLVNTLSPAINPEHLVEPEIVRFASYDDLEIPGLLYRPHSASPDRPIPAMIWLRGSTDGQARAVYTPLIQYLVNQGYAVYAINHRGSSGYGKSFGAASYRRHGEADLKDVVQSRHLLTNTGWIDPKRIGVMGMSYGGFMAMAALTFHPDEFAVGVNLFGVTNWIRTLEEWSTLRPWSANVLQRFYDRMGDPVADRERLHRISPLFHAHRIKKPFIVLHGANDSRVLQVESDEIVEAARANNVLVEYIVFPDEGHGFQKKENQKFAYKAIGEFLDQHLKGQER